MRQARCAGVAVPVLSHVEKRGIRCAGQVAENRCGVAGQVQAVQCSGREGVRKEKAKAQVVPVPEAGTEAGSVPTNQTKMQNGKNAGVCVCGIVQAGREGRKGEVVQAGSRKLGQAAKWCVAKFKLLPQNLSVCPPPTSPSLPVPT